MGYLFFLLLLFWIIISVDDLKRMPESIFDKIHEYSYEFDSLLLKNNKYDTNLISTSKSIRNQVINARQHNEANMNNCEHNARQIVLRRIIRSIDSSAIVDNTACILLEKKLGWRGQLISSILADHVNIFWQWFVLYGSNAVIYSKSIQEFSYDSNRNSIIIRNGLCSLMFINCNISRNIDMIVLPSIINPTNKIYKVFGDGNDGLSSITIDTRQFDNNGELISNNIITNIDFNKLKFSPKLDVIIVGYDIEYKSNDIFPKMSISRGLEIIFVPPIQANRMMNFRKIELLKPTSAQMGTFYHRMYFREIGSRFMSYYTRTIQIILPAAYVSRIPYRYVVFIDERPCDTCNIWPSCSIDIYGIRIWSLDSRFKFGRHSYRGPIYDIWNRVEKFFDRTCNSFTFVN